MNCFYPNIIFLDNLLGKVDFHVIKMKIIAHIVNNRENLLYCKSD